MWSKNDKGNPLQYSCLENPMDGGAWCATVYWVAKSWARLSDFTFTFHFHALEKEMAPHSSVLACRIPGTEEPGGLPSMGSQSWTRLKRLSSSSSKNGKLSSNISQYSLTYFVFFYSKSLWFQNYHLFIPSFIPSYSMVIPSWHSFPYIQWPMNNKDKYFIMP